MKFLVGLFIGAALGVIFAPPSGEESRRQLRIKAQEMEQRAKETARETAGEIGRITGERMFDEAVGENR